MADEDELSSESRCPIHVDRRARERQELESKLLAGLDSPPREMTAEDWAKLRQELRDKSRSRRPR